MDLYFLSNTRWFYPNKLEALISYIITRVYYYKLSVSVNVNIDIIMLPRYKKNKKKRRGRRGCDHMLVGFTTTYAISAYHR